MAELSTQPRPEVVVADDDTLTNPEGWTQVIVAADKRTVVCAWDDAGTFHQWETTEDLVQQLCDALAQCQIALTLDRT